MLMEILNCESTYRFAFFESRTRARRAVKIRVELRTFERRKCTFLADLPSAKNRIAMPQESRKSQHIIVMRT